MASCTKCGHFHFAEPKLCYWCRPRKKGWNREAFLQRGIEQARSASAQRIRTREEARLKLHTRRGKRGKDSETAPGLI